MQMQQPRLKLYAANLIFPCIEMYNWQNVGFLQKHTPQVLIKAQNTVFNFVRYFSHGL